MTAPLPPLLRSPLLAERGQVVHGFTTRAGGVSRGPLDSLNLARRPGEDDASLVENWRRAAAACGRSTDDLVLLAQVHGGRVLRVDSASGPLAVAGEADAAITTRPGLLLAVRTADCVPILIAADGGVAVVHSGWRSAAAGVVGATVAALTEATGARPETFAAVIGPHISGAAYEVGPEVPAGLRAAGLSDACFLVTRPDAESTAAGRDKRGKRPGLDDSFHVDLGLAVIAQLHAAGVADIDHLNLCTRSDSRFYSHRGDGRATGRQAGLIGLCR